MRRPLSCSCLVLPLLGAIACGGGSDDPEDARVDARGPDYTYVVSDVTIPTSAEQAAMIALDVDGVANDGRENQLGLVMAAVNALAPEIAVEATLDRRVARGELIALFNVNAFDLANASGVGVRFYDGANPVPAACESAADQECRRHLAGNASFEATPREDNTAAGRIVNGTFMGTAPRLTLRLGELALPLQLVKIESRMVDRAALDRVLIVGAIAAADLDAVFIPGLTAVVRATAPAVTDADVAGAVHGVALDIDTDDNGTYDALSVGVAVQAVPAWFVPVR